MQLSFATVAFLGLFGCCASANNSEVEQNRQRRLRVVYPIRDDLTTKQQEAAEDEAWLRTLSEAMVYAGSEDCDYHDHDHRNLMLGKHSKKGGSSKRSVRGTGKGKDGYSRKKKACTKQHKLQLESYYDLVFSYSMSMSMTEPPVRSPPATKAPVVVPSTAPVVAPSVAPVSSTTDPTEGTSLEPTFVESEEPDPVPTGVPTPIPSTLAPVTPAPTTLEPTSTVIPAPTTPEPTATFEPSGDPTAEPTATVEPSGLPTVEGTETNVPV